MTRDTFFLGLFLVVALLCPFAFIGFMFWSRRAIQRKFERDGQLLRPQLEQEGILFYEANVSGTVEWRAALSWHKGPRIADVFVTRSGIYIFQSTVAFGRKSLAQPIVVLLSNAIPLPAGPLVAAENLTEPPVLLPAAVRLHGVSTRWNVCTRSTWILSIRDLPGFARAAASVFQAGGAPAS